MNGARALIQTLVDSGVEVCFTNPGTSEMHFVAALDEVEGMSAMLCLFEGGATGAADGYARMAGKPAATLLHLGPGLGNGFANLHNARRAGVPMVNVVGDHATYHKQYDAPLESDMDAIAGACSGEVIRSTRPEEVATDAATAVARSLASPNQVVTLALPADVCWLDSPGPVSPIAPPAPKAVDAGLVASLAQSLAAPGAVLLLGNRALRERPLVAAARVAAATGAKLMAETFPTREERGAGLPRVERVAYLAEFAQMQLAGAGSLVAVDAAAPVSFFAYPDKASVLTPEGCDVVVVDQAHDPAELLEALVDHLDAPAEFPVAEAFRPELPSGALDAESLGAVIGALLPEGAIVVDESNTSGLFINGMTAGAPRHDWLCLTGGAIGFGIPTATGAAVACPDRPVINLEADGSAMYTLQALWTQARENLNVTTIILKNSSYAVLNMELNRVGAEAGGPKAKRMLDLSGPDLDFVALARGLGVDASRATTAEELATALQSALSAPGPQLIEAVIPPLGL